MANLETLELTINGSAEKAGQGIDSLISRLSSLSDAISKPLAGLQSFRGELEKIHNIAKNLVMPQLDVKTSTAKIAKSVAARSKLYKPEGKTVSPDEAFRLTQQASKLELLQEKYGGMMERYIPNAVAGNFDSKQLADGAIQIQKIQSEINGIKNTAENTPTVMSKIKDGFGNMTEGASKFFSRVKRIATTMLIRSAIRNLIKDMKEGVNNLYEWSKLNKGEFAQSFDAVKAKALQLKNSMGAAIAPVIQAAIPIINALANAAINAFNWVNQLISLLTGKSYWTQATANVDGYTDSLEKSGGAAQEWLATFDELNVMTSGGGGGGGKGKADYSDLFENVYQFDTKLKEITDFLKENFESIKAMAIATGVAILGWKLSTGFAEVLPTLSKIAGLIGVGAVIGITLQADWLLTNKYLQTGEEGWLIAGALTTAVGSVAAAAMAKQIFGGNAGYYAAGITLALSAVTDIVANIKNTNVAAFSKESLLTSVSSALKLGGAAGIILSAAGMSGLPLLIAASGGAALTFLASIGLKLITQKKDIKWGDISLTNDQIEAFVNERMFETNPRIIVNLVSENIEAGKVEREKIQKDLAEIVGTCNLIRLGIDMNNSGATLKDQTEQLIADILEYTNNARDTGKLTLQFTPTLAGNTPDEQASWFTGYSEGWNIVDEFYKTKGKEIADLFVENEKGEIELKNPELLQTIMSSLNEVTSAITESNVVSKALADMSIGLGDLTQASGEQVLSYFRQYKLDLEKSYEGLVAEQYIKQGELVAALGKIDPNSEAYKEALTEYERMGKNLANAVQDGVESKIEPGKNMVLEWLLGNHAAGSIDSSYIKEELALTTLTDHLQEILYSYLNMYGDLSDVEINVAKEIKFSGWDLLSKDLKKSFLAAVRIDENTIKELKAMDVPADELVKLVDWSKVENMAQNDFVKAMTAAYGSSGISAIKYRFPNIKAADVIKFSAWDEFSNVEKLNFLDAIEKAFGANEAKNAAKSAGKDIETAIREGMDSNNEDIRKQAEKWAGIIGLEIKKGDYTVNPTMPKTGEHSPEGIANGIKTVIGNTKAVVDKITAKFLPGYPDNLKGDVENVHPIMKPIAEITESVKNTLINVIQAIKPTITANVKATGVSELSSSLKKALSSTLKLQYNGGTLGSITLQAKAGGGLVTSGDMFIANENGVPEMIGRFGNQTGVANTGQIVAGISKGVSDANAEQNALLREQNALLRAIYEKEGSNGFPGASSALGRVVRQSLNMYDGVTGG